MWEILGGLLIGSVVSGVVPIVNAELLVAGAALAVPAVGVPAVAVVSAVGQMLSKTFLFAVARWAPSRLPIKAQAALQRASDAVARRRGGVGSVVFASAAVGLPPFYGVSLAAGALGMRTHSFVVTGGAGRLLRFGALAFAAHHVGAGFLEAL